MSKVSLFALIVILAPTILCFGGCGGKTGNGGIPNAAVIPDESEKDFGGLNSKILSDSKDPAGSPISNSDACKTKDSDGHKIIDGRLIPGTQFVKTTTVGQSGAPVRS